MRISFLPLPAAPAAASGSAASGQQAQLLQTNISLAFGVHTIEYDCSTRISRSRRACSCPRFSSPNFRSPSNALRCTGRSAAARSSSWKRQSIYCYCCFHFDPSLNAGTQCVATALQYSTILQYSRLLHTCPEAPGPGGHASCRFPAGCGSATAACSRQLSSCSWSCGVLQGGSINNMGK